MTAAADVRPYWRRRLLWPFLVLVGLNALVFAAYTLPRTLQERNLAERAKILETEVEKERARVDQLRGRVDTLEANARDTERFYKTVVGGRKEDLVSSVEAMVKLAARLGLKPGNWSLRPERVKGTELVRVTVTMPVSGQYHQLVGFLDALERSEHFLVIDRVQLHERNSERAGQADLSLNLSAYFRAEGEAANAQS